MPVVVPVLRLCYVSLNVYETFKTVKLPPPSARNGGQPSVRAMTQRKRAMKGCMAVWMVWCCFALYERFVDGMIRIFIPFYDEIKSLILLFFLVTRARGAEPIYLHCLRPLIKPHVSTLDAAFGLCVSVGDLILLLSSIPMNFVHGLYSRWLPAYSSGAQLTSLPARPPMDDRSTFGGSTHSVQSIVTADSGYASATSIPDVLRPGFKKTPSHSSAQQIWYPPPSAYEDTEIPRYSGLPTPPSDNPPPYTTSAPVGHNVEEEWRQYPAFPSAYPPTPLPTSGKLSSDIVMPVPMRHIVAQFSGIPEEPHEQEVPDFIPPRPETTTTPQQGFRRSLKSPRESQNPDSDGSLSDSDRMHGIQPGYDVVMTAEDEADYDVEDHLEEEEDSFDVTLRTPFSKARKDQLELPTIMLPSMSTDSHVSRSTALSTSDNGSSLRTRTNSEVSHVSSISKVPSDDSSTSGRKRRVAQSDDEDSKASRFLVEKPPSSKLPTRARSRPVARTMRTSKNSSASSNGDENIRITKTEASSDSSLGHKKRKVTMPAARPPPRTMRKITEEARFKALNASRTSKLKGNNLKTSSARRFINPAVGSDKAATMPSSTFTGVEVTEDASGARDSSDSAGDGA